MNWHMIIYGLIIVVLKMIGMIFFLLYFPQTFGSSNVTVLPTQSYGTVCPNRWYFHQGKCFWLSPFEMSWNESRDFCKTEGSTLAIVNTLEKLKFLQNIIGAEKYFIGLYQDTEKRWRWINNSPFNGNITSQQENFNCVTIGLTNTFDASSCDINLRWICEKLAK
ncbi:C-type lectin domain family 5 member A isoform X2 [Crocuta crocuta]